MITVTLSTSFAGLGAGQPCTHCGILLQDMNQIKLLLPPGPLYSFFFFLRIILFQSQKNITQKMLSVETWSIKNPDLTASVDF